MKGLAVAPQDNRSLANRTNQPEQTNDPAYHATSHFRPGSACGPTAFNQQEQDNVAAEQNRRRREHQSGIHVASPFDGSHVHARYFQCSPGQLEDHR